MKIILFLYKAKFLISLDNNKITQIIANKIYSGDNIKNRLTKKINIKIEYEKNNLDNFKPIKRVMQNK